MRDTDLSGLFITCVILGLLAAVFAGLGTAG